MKRMTMVIAAATAVISLGLIQGFVRSEVSARAKYEKEYSEAHTGLVSRLTTFKNTLTHNDDVMRRLTQLSTELAKLPTLESAISEVNTAGNKASNEEDGYAYTQTVQKIIDLYVPLDADYHDAYTYIPNLTFDGYWSTPEPSEHSLEAESDIRALTQTLDAVMKPLADASDTLSRLRFKEEHAAAIRKEIAERKAKFEQVLLHKDQ
jgi:uncharacterized protein YoxC